MKQNQKSLAYVYLIMTFVLWGSLYVVSKFVLGKLPAFTISFLRFVLAFAALTLFQRGKTVRIEKKDYGWIFLIGIAGYFVAVGAQLLGTKYAGASLASLLNSLNPVTMTIFAAILLHEKLTLKKIIGILLALSGVYLILGGGAQGSGIGIFLSLFSVLLWSAVSVLMRRVTQRYDSLQITRYGIGIAAVCYLPACLAELSMGEPVSFDLSCVLALMYMGVICTGVAYLLWNKSLSMLEAGTCSAFYPLQPMVSTLLGIILLGEQVQWMFWLGAGLIIAGVLTSLTGNRKTSLNQK